MAKQQPLHRNRKAVTVPLQYKQYLHLKHFVLNVYVDNTVKGHIQILFVIARTQRILTVQPCFQS